MKLHDISELNRIYDSAEQADKDVFAEQRTNVLLVAGDHYTKTSKHYQNTVRTSKDLTENQKLRLTKNHQFRISEIWQNSILAYAPGVAIEPQQEGDLSDEKDAELNNSVYEYYKYKHRFKEMYRNWCSDFIDLGECCGEILWDPNKGEFVGYEQQADPDGNPMFDEMGEPVADEERPVFKGDFVFNRIFAFNLLREASSTDMRQSRCWIVRDMVPKVDLKARYKNDPDKLKIIEQTSEEEFVVFDASRKGYEKSKENTLLRKYYYPKCVEYPEGYYYIATNGGVLEHGPLPGGIFPVVWGAFRTHQTSPRGRSILKQTRPFQAEINRASSQTALHQVTIGDDKILYQSGTKLASGALLPGVRGLTYQGAAPEILPGRDGSQFLPYIQAQIEEMYMAAMLDKVDEELTANLEPYTLLYRSASQQKKFKPFAERFEQFLVDFVTTFLELARFYLPDDELIPAIGRDELVNISEFRSSSPLNHKICVEPQDDTVETRLGRQLSFERLIQYAGSQLSREDIGRIAKHMPYGIKGAFEDITIDQDVADNMLLALDRGEEVDISTEDDDAYMIQRIDQRKRKADFKYLPPETQQYYEAVKQGYIQQMAAKEEHIQRLKSEFIPADGPLIACDMYVENEDPTKAAKRVRLPERGLEWLVKQYEVQGMTLDKFESMNHGSLAQLAQTMQQNQQPAPNGLVAPMQGAAA